VATYSGGSTTPTSPGAQCGSCVSLPTERNLHVAIVTTSARMMLKLTVARLSGPPSNLGVGVAIGVKLFVGETCTCVKEKYICIGLLVICRSI
jgi:hypothetical protein